MVPCRFVLPDTKASASTRLVLPLAPCPTTAMFRISEPLYSLIQRLLRSSDQGSVSLSFDRLVPRTRGVKWRTPECAGWRVVEGSPMRRAGRRDAVRVAGSGVVQRRPGLQRQRGARVGAP